MTLKPEPATPRPIPAPLVTALMAFLAMAAGFGVASLNSYSPLPTTALLDAWILSLIVAALIRGRTTHSVVMVGLAGYLCTRLVPALIDHDPWYDVLQAYRWVIYLLAFTVATNLRWGSTKNLRVATLALIALAFIKALLTTVIVGTGTRPGLFLENNFEIPLFCGLLITQHRTMSRQQIVFATSLLGMLMLFAGSRSGAIAYAILLIFNLARTHWSRATKLLVGLYAAPALLAIPLWVFVSRDAAAGGARIDRLNFFDVFIRETSQWTALNWLFGTEPITPLTDAGCTSLSFYENLFATTGDGTCFSVIFHAFFLRVVFDAGLLGLILAFALPWWLMNKTGVDRSVTLATLAIAAANSLSVSGLNNPYVALPVIIALMTASRRPASVLDCDDGPSTKTKQVQSIKPIRVSSRNLGKM